MQTKNPQIRANHFIRMCSRPNDTAGDAVDHCIHDRRSQLRRNYAIMAVERARARGHVRNVHAVLRVSLSVASERFVRGTCFDFDLSPAPGRVVWSLSHCGQQVSVVWFLVVFDDSVKVAPCAPRTLEHAAPRAPKILHIAQCQQTTAYMGIVCTLFAIVAVDHWNVSPLYDSRSHTHSKYHASAHGRFPTSVDQFRYRRPLGVRSSRNINIFVMHAAVNHFSTMPRSH